MNLEMTDKEQIEMLKSWWHENGKFTLFCIVAAIVLSFGWRYWQSHKLQEAGASSVLYEQLLTHESQQQYSQAEYDVTSMLTIHPKSPYAALAAFLAAQNALRKNDYQGALEKYDWVLKNSNNKDFRQLTKLRKARVLIQLKEYDQALKVLAQSDADAYLPAINEVKGDIYSAKGDNLSAHLAYSAALRSSNQNSPNRSLLEMKYDQTAG